MSTTVILNSADSAGAGGVTAPARPGLTGLTAGLTAAALMAIFVQAWPAAQEALQLHAGGVAAGQIWRLVTGHLTHWSWPHAISDTATFVGLCILGSRCPRRLAILTAVLAVTVSVAVLLFGGSIEVYRGLSGISYGLLTWLLWGYASREQRWLQALWLGCLVYITTKTVLDCFLPLPLLPNFLPDGIAVAGSAHLAGIAKGFAFSIIDRIRVGSRVDCCKEA